MSIEPHNIRNYEFSVKNSCITFTLDEGSVDLNLTRGNYKGAKGQSKVLVDYFFEKDMYPLYSLAVYGKVKYVLELRDQPYTYIALTEDYFTTGELSELYVLDSKLNAYDDVEFKRAFVEACAMNYLFMKSDRVLNSFEII